MNSILYSMKNKQNILTIILFYLFKNVIDKNKKLI